jgi:hypothetical protein
MKTVTKYEARDGKVFDTEALALEHESFLDLVDELDTSSVSWYSTNACEVAEWLTQNYILVKKEPKAPKQET